MGKHQFSVTLQQLFPRAQVGRHRLLNLVHLKNHRAQNHKEKSNIKCSVKSRVILAAFLPNSNSTENKNY